MPMSFHYFSDVIVTECRCRNIELTSKNKILYAFTYIDNLMRCVLPNESLLNDAFFPGGGVVDKLVAQDGLRGFVSFPGVQRSNHHCHLLQGTVISNRFAPLSSS